MQRRNIGCNDMREQFRRGIVRTRFNSPRHRSARRNVACNVNRARRALKCVRIHVRKGDVEKCVCGANGGECSATGTRAEPAAECSSEPNAEAASFLGYCAQK